MWKTKIAIRAYDEVRPSGSCPLTARTPIRSKWLSPKSKLTCAPLAQGTLDALRQANGQICDLFEPEECRNCFDAAAMDSPERPPLLDSSISGRIHGKATAPKEISWTNTIIVARFFCLEACCEPFQYA